MANIDNFFLQYSSIDNQPKDVEAFYKYFRFEYHFFDYDNYVRLYCYVQLLNSSKHAGMRAFIIDENGIRMDNDQNLLMPYERENIVYNDLMMNWLISNTRIVEDSKYWYNKIFNHQKEVYKKEFNESIGRIIDTLTLKDEEKVSSPVKLIPSVEYFDDNRTYVSLKVGRNKFYSIPKIKDFISRVENNVNHKYGKELQFVHSINIFDEQSQKLFNFIRLHSDNDFSRYYDKYIGIDNKHINELFGLYKNGVISVKDNNYTIRLKAYTPTIHIDDKYLLSVNIPEDCSLITDSTILINDKDGTIDELSCDNELITLISEILSSPFPSIDGNVDTFKYNILLRYPNYFTFDASIEDEFTFEEMDIKAYFDFIDGVIQLKTELYINDKEIREKDLNKFNLLQYRRYIQIISAYGFENNLLTDQSKILNFLMSDFSELKKIADVYLSDTILNKNLSVFQAPQIKINYNNNLLDVFIDESKYSDEELLKVLKAIKQKKKFILLKNDIIDISNANAELFAEHIKEYQLDELKPQKLPIYYAFKSLDDLQGVSLNEKIGDILGSIKNFKNSDLKIGKINGELRNYQKDGVRWLNILYSYGLSGILADDMGLGKTIEIISFIESIKEEKPILIVAPKSLIFNWKYEFSRFNEKQEVVLIYGDKQNRINLIRDIKNDKKIVYITGYDSIRMDEELYSDTSFNVLILDEAQAIKNSQAKKSISVSKINSNVRFVLTGTPIENSVLDLWSLFNFLMPTYFPNINEFKNRYENDDNYKVIVKKKITPFILRRNKKDVLKELPNKYELMVTCDMNEAQRKTYDAYRYQAKTILNEGGDAFDVLHILTRLRQICIDPSLFIDNYHDGSGKIDELVEMINDKISEGHRILLFSQFVKALELIETKLKENDISYSLITGATKGEERLEIANEFNGNKRIKVMLVSLKAGGTGLNLIGADVVIHLDPWWNVAAQDQATDRAYRIGQEKNVEVIKLICNDSIEQRVVELQNKKKEIIAQLISEDESSITKMSKEDIEYILK